MNYLLSEFAKKMRPVHQETFLKGEDFIKIKCHSYLDDPLYVPGWIMGIESQTSYRLSKNSTFEFSFCILFCFSAVQVGHKLSP